MAIQTIAESKIIFKKGKPTEVVLKWRDFQELLEKIEDVYDLFEIKKIKKASFKNFNAVLGKYGLSSFN